jgi:hypothetical protein
LPCAYGFPITESGAEGSAGRSDPAKQASFDDEDGKCQRSATEPMLVGVFVFPHLSDNEFNGNGVLDGEPVNACLAFS